MRRKWALLRGAPIEDGPSPRPGETEEAGVGVDDARVVDGLEHREVGEGVAIKIGALEVDIGGRGPILGASDFALAVTEGFLEFTE